MQLVLRDISSGVTCVVRVCRSWRARLRGLMGTDAGTSPIVLVSCASVHTFFMRYPIDLAFVSPSGLVLKACAGVPAKRVVSARGAGCVVERPHADGPWFEVGMRLVATDPRLPSSAGEAAIGRAMGARWARTG